MGHIEGNAHKKVHNVKSLDLNNLIVFKILCTSKRAGQVCPGYLQYIQIWINLYMYGFYFLVSRYLNLYVSRHNFFLPFKLNKKEN